MSESTQPKSSRFYDGVWGILTRVFCVPRHAPVLPAFGPEEIVSRKPSAGFLRYLKFQFWVGVFVATVALTVASIAILVAAPSAWYVLVPAAFAMLVFAVSVIAYLAIQLRYDTTWYVFSDRSMRLRRGIWLIRESTITFENIQNVSVSQGPLQRYFGIANLVVETAGGGGAKTEPGAGLGMHAGLIEGVAEATAIRDSIMTRVRATNTTGLGDEEPQAIASRQGWSPRHLQVLREIRDLAKQAATT